MKDREQRFFHLPMKKNCEKFCKKVAEWCGWLISDHVSIEWGVPYLGGVEYYCLSMALFACLHLVNPVQYPGRGFELDSGLV